MSKATSPPPPPLHIWTPFREILDPPLNVQAEPLIYTLDPLMKGHESPSDFTFIA